jgi:hypothetical protein
MHQTGRHEGFDLFLSCKCGKLAAKSFFLYDSAIFVYFSLCSAPLPFSLLRIYLCRAWWADFLSAWRYRSSFLTDGGNSGRARREYWRGLRGDDWRRRGGDNDDSDWGLFFWDWYSLRLARVTVRQLERGVIGVNRYWFSSLKSLRFARVVVLLRGMKNGESLNWFV